MKEKGLNEIIILAGLIVACLSLYFIFKSDQKVNVRNTELIPTVTLNCAEAGQKPISNFDERTGKVNKSITVIECCKGLKAIQDKQEGGIKRTSSGDVLCRIVMGGNNSICSPCGNGKCDTDFEDICNCRIDCKE
jgi:hypothetical protein